MVFSINRLNYFYFQIPDHIVHFALIKPREEFIDLFLAHGLLLHLYLNHKRLHNLFENPADKDFFITVCLEGVLGKSIVSILLQSMSFKKKCFYIMKVSIFARIFFILYNLTLDCWRIKKNVCVCLEGGRGLVL